MPDTMETRTDLDTYTNYDLLSPSLNRPSKASRYVEKWRSGEVEKWRSGEVESVWDMFTILLLDTHFLTVVLFNVFDVFGPFTIGNVFGQCIPT